MQRLVAVLTFILAFILAFALTAGTRLWIAAVAAVGSRQAGGRTQVAEVESRASRVDGSGPAFDPDRPPKLVLERTSADAGEVLAGQPVKFAFLLKNTGLGPLEVIAKPHCGCTLVHFDTEIPPGGESSLEAELRTSAMGPANKTIDLVTNDPQRPKVLLALSARVVPAVEVLPSPHPIFSLKMEGETVQELVLRPRAGVEVAGLTCSEPYVRPEVVGTLHAPSACHDSDSHPGPPSLVLRLTFGPDAPLGKSTVRLTVATNAPTQPQITITVRCEKGIIVSPSSVLFRVGQSPSTHSGESAGDASDLVRPKGPTATATRTVVMNRSEGAFHIDRVTSSDQRISAAVEPIKEGSSYRIQVQYNGEPPGGANATLTVHTDDPHQPQVYVPVRII